MAFNRFWPAVTSLTLSQNASNAGVVSVPSTVGFYKDQIVNLSGSGLNTANYVVSQILSQTQLVLANNYNNVTGVASLPDLSGYTTTALSQIAANQQPKNIKTPWQDVLPASYEAEPTVALRVVQVDQYGNYDGADGLPVSPQYVRVAAASITTSNSSNTTALQVMSLSRNIKVLTIMSDLNQDCSITYNGNEYLRMSNTATQYILTFELGVNGLYYNQSATIGVFQNGTAPTTGLLRITGNG